eukprot:gene17532-biopygen12377
MAPGRGEAKIEPLPFDRSTSFEKQSLDQKCERWRRGAPRVRVRRRPRGAVPRGAAAPRRRGRAGGEVSLTGVMGKCCGREPVWEACGEVVLTLCGSVPDFAEKCCGEEFLTCGKVSLAFCHVLARATGAATPTASAAATPSPGAGR